MSEHILVDGNWKKASKVQLDGIPVGFSLPFRATQPPYGWLVEDGREISRTTYAKLFSVIGTMYGEGDGETTFNLPNSIGKYTKFGIGEEVGTELEAGLPNITGEITDVYGYGYARLYTGGSNGALYATGTTGNSNVAGTNYTSSDYTKGFAFNAANSNSIYGNSDTVTPPSLIALPCIKAFDTIADEVKINLAVELEALKAQLANAKFVVETWNENTEWYRVWSDGWIEQGGVLNAGGADIYNATLNYTYKKAFTGTPTLITQNKDTNRKSADTNTTRTITNESNSGFSMFFLGGLGNSNGINWYACGY